MRTPHNLAEEKATQIAFYSIDPDDTVFFDKNLKHVWLDYDFKHIKKNNEALGFFENALQTSLLPDLVLVSNRSWHNGGEDLVRLIRSHPDLSALPIYCITFCQKRLKSLDSHCSSISWRQKTNCDEDLIQTTKPFLGNLLPGHPARLDGTICTHNLETELPNILNNMVDNWFYSWNGSC